MQLFATMRCAFALVLVVLGGFGCGSVDGQIPGDAGSSPPGPDAALPPGAQIINPDGAAPAPGQPPGGGPGRDAGSGVTVRWNHACWDLVNGQRYQAIRFDLVAPAPLPLKGTLFFTTTCDPSKGTQENDDVATIGTGTNYDYHFTDHPGETATSAIWQIADQSSGCIDYEHAPDCH